MRYYVAWVTVEDEEPAAYYVCASVEAAGVALKEAEDTLAGMAEEAGLLMRPIYTHLEAYDGIAELLASPYLAGFRRYPALRTWEQAIQREPLLALAVPANG